MDSQQFPCLLRQARDGEQAVIGILLEEFRPYLLLLAQRQFDPRLQSRVDPVDLVQVSFMEAHRDFSSFRGDAIGEFAAWLRTILQRNVMQSRERHLDAQCRSLQREQRPGTDSGQRHIINLASDHSSPSRRAMLREEAVRLASALAMLPVDQGEAIRLRHLEGWSLKEIAAAMNRSDAAVAGLVKRGLRQLRVLLSSEDGVWLRPQDLRH